MRERSRPWASALIALALSFVGCDRLFEKGSKDELARGARKATAGDFRGAVAAYEAALDGTAATAEAHYSLALIYEGKLKSPRDAVHHLDRYLELAPEGNHAKDAKNLRKETELKLALNAGKGTFTTQEEAVRLKNDNLTLRKLLAEVRAQKSGASVPQSSTSKGGEAAQKPIPPGTRTHVVQSGETMASIAHKYYKNKARWKDIQDANFYSTGGTPKIKVGQTLIIP